MKTNLDRTITTQDEAEDFLNDVSFTHSTLSQHEIKEVLTISENFKLFFNNLTK